MPQYFHSPVGKAKTRWMKSTRLAPLIGLLMLFLLRYRTYATAIAATQA